MKPNTKEIMNRTLPNIDTCKLILQPLDTHSLFTSRLVSKAFYLASNEIMHQRAGQCHYGVRKFIQISQALGERLIERPASNGVDFEFLHQNIYYKNLNIIIGDDQTLTSLYHFLSRAKHLANYIRDLSISMPKRIAAKTDLQTIILTLLSICPEMLKLTLVGQVIDNLNSLQDYTQLRELLIESCNPSVELNNLTNLKTLELKNQKQNLVKLDNLGIQKLTIHIMNHTVELKNLKNLTMLSLHELKSDLKLEQNDLPNLERLEVSKHAIKSSLFKLELFPSLKHLVFPRMNGDSFILQEKDFPNLVSLEFTDFLLIKNFTMDNFSKLQHLEFKGKFYGNCFNIGSYPILKKLEYSNITNSLIREKLEQLISKDKKLEISNKCTLISLKTRIESHHLHSTGKAYLSILDYLLKIEEENLALGDEFLTTRPGLFAYDDNIFNNLCEIYCYLKNVLKINYSIQSTKDTIDNLHLLTTIEFNLLDEGFSKDLFPKIFNVLILAVQQNRKNILNYILPSLNSFSDNIFFNPEMIEKVSELFVQNEASLWR